MPRTSSQLKALHSQLPNKQVAFRAQLEASDSRTETFEGREYLVVPVIALVEGVLQAMNAPTPELALASEFGKVPASWNGRPVVMNHPVVDGSPISANSPHVLEEYRFGYIFNTELVDGKLKTEAWLDIERVAELGGEIAETVDRIQNGELVEVSTGLFCATQATVGRFNNREYQAVWRNVIPDHLAFLSEGILGACSGEDGCGVRANTAAASTGWGEFIMPQKNDNASKPALKNHDGSVAVNTKTGTVAISDNAGVTDILKDSERVITPEVLSATDCGCDGAPVIIANGAKDGDGDAAELKDFVATFDSVRLVDNAAPAGMVDSDVRKLLSQAVRSVEMYSGYAYVVQFTAEKVIYEVYDRYTSYDYVYLSRSYSISEEGAVTLGGDVERVNLLTKVVPYAVHTDATSGLTANSSQPGEPAMPDNPTTTDPAVTTPATTVTPVATESATVTANATPKIKTMAEYIGEMPAEMAEVFQSGLKLHNEKKSGLIKALKDSGRCSFDDAYLNTQSLEVLQNLAQLAAVPTYEGVAPAVRDNAGGDGNAEMFAPVAPRMNFGSTAAN